MSYTIPANTFSDFENITVTASPLPAGVTYNSATKTFSGTPTIVSSTVITVTATDNHGETNTTTFTFDVRANTAPTFNPTPIVDHMYNVGSTIGFLIAVTDAEGDVTTTTAVDPPTFLTWTTPSFNNNTVTTAAHAGIHTIAMRVCDVWNACTIESF